MRDSGVGSKMYLKMSGGTLMLVEEKMEGRRVRTLRFGRAAVTLPGRRDADITEAPRERLVTSEEVVGTMQYCSAT